MVEVLPTIAGVEDVHATVVNLSPFGTAAGGTNNGPRRNVMNKRSAYQPGWRFSLFWFRRG